MAAELCLQVLFIGDDWAEDHHDLEIEDQDGRRLVRVRLPEGVEASPGCTRWWPSMRPRLARSSGRRGLVQDTLLQAHRSIDRFDGAHPAPGC